MHSITAIVGLGLQLMYQQSNGHWLTFFHTQFLCYYESYSQPVDQSLLVEMSSASVSLVAGIKLSAKRVMVTF